MLLDQTLLLKHDIGGVNAQSQVCTSTFLEIWLTGIGKFLIPLEVDQSVVSRLIQGSIAAPIL